MKRGIMRKRNKEKIHDDPTVDRSRYGYKSPSTLVAEGFLTISDAAGQTVPMTGCWVGRAMVGGKSR